MKYILPAVLLCSLMLALPARAATGSLAPALRQKMETMAEDDRIRVIIKPVSIYDRQSFKTTIMNHKTRATRHRIAAEQLKTIAETSQRPIRSFLRSFEQKGEAKNIRYFWVANLVEAELSPASLRQMAANPDIDLIDLYPRIIPIPITEEESRSPGEIGVESNLVVVNAPAAWAAGYDGTGRVVCNFDTGVEGDHPALIDNYRGNKGYPSSQCWYSPTDSSTFPHSFSIPHHTSGEPHGTQTMGIMIGHDDLSGDTIGVAPGADWIAAVAIQVAGSSIIATFQWAADPDGDPNTISDVPDVINHSWGFESIGCDSIFWELIDNTEALGIVNIFAAGNSGPLEASIANPANRADDSITNFAVGAIYDVDLKIYSFSSRGPSDCDDASIKPNLVAPGQLVRTSVLGSKYSPGSGTSMAAPHVSGAVAILRQKNPDATVAEIKNALLNSAQDLGTVGPDNDFGWGLIDITAALDLIPPISEPLVDLAGLIYPVIYAGDSLGIRIELKNSGTAASNVTAQFSNPGTGLLVYTGQINFGNLDRDMTAEGDTTLDLKIDPAVPDADFVSLDMDIYIDGVSHRHQRLNVYIGERGRRTYYNHDTGRLKFTISNYGAYGFGGTNLIPGSIGSSFTPLGFYGFKLDRDTNDIYEASFIIGTDSAHISDCAQNFIDEPDNDFNAAPGGSITVAVPGSSADAETYSSFDDTWAENPLGLTIRQNSYAWSAAPNDNYIILEYFIYNNSGTALNNIHSGLYIDWNINHYSENRGDFLSGDELGFIYWTDGVDSSDFRGVGILEPSGMANHFVFSVPDEVQNGAFHEGRKYRGLTDPSRPSYTLISRDISHLTSVGPIDLPDGDSVRIAFTVAGEETLDLLQNAVQQAAQKYSEIVTAVDNPSDIRIPELLVLRQNFPNPFNASTTITFSLPESGRVKMEIYNILGEKVKTIANNPFRAGNHTLTWNGTDQENQTVASGIYFYKLTFKESSSTRQMILMK